MSAHLLLTTTLVSALVVLQTAVSASSSGESNYQSRQWDQYVAQTCDPVNDPSTCKPG